MAYKPRKRKVKKIFQKVMLIFIQPLTTRL